MTEYKKRASCAICKNKKLHTVLRFGKVPLAGDFPTEKELNSEKSYNLTIVFCEKCSLLQTDSIIDADTLFKDYRYASSIGLQNHFNSLSKLLKSRFKLNSKSKVIEIGSNDGVFQAPMKDLRVEVIGFEPAVNISKIAIEKGCKVINDYFSYDNVKNKYKLSKSADLVVSTNTFAHIDSIHSIVMGVKEVLKKNGHFLIEVHYVKNLIESFQYDFIYHEHLYYYSLTALYNLFSRYDMTVVDFEEIPIHSGSIRVVAKNAKEKINNKIAERLTYESKNKIDKIEYYESFANDVKEHIAMTQLNLKQLKSEGKKIVGYGASGRANMFCNFNKITPDLVDYIVDESTERNGRYITKMHIPIVTKEHLLKDKKKPDYVMLFAWNFAKMIMQKLEGNNYKYILPFPTFRIVKKAEELENFVSI